MLSIPGMVMTVIMCCPVTLLDLAAEFSELINWIMHGYLLLKQCLNTSCCQYQINVSLNSHLTYWPKKRKLISRQLIHIISSIDAPAVEIKNIVIKLASAVECKRNLLCCVHVSQKTTFCLVCIRKSLILVAY